MTFATRRPRVLIVDDSVHVLASVSRKLREFYEVATTTSLAGALAQLDEVVPDLILLDFMLDDATGDQAVAALRAKRAEIPIILMSGSFSASFAETLVYGADDFISKPFEGEALVSKIERQLVAGAQRVEVDSNRAQIKALLDRREEEARIAQSVLDRMLQRGVFDPSLIRHAIFPLDRFAGDIVFGAPVGDRYRWMIGDVTGHTLASALVTIPLSLMFYATAAKYVPLEEAIATMNVELGKLLPVNMFCAAAACELDRSTGVLRVWNGGMPDVIIKTAGGAIVRVPSSDPPLAVDRRHSVPEVTEIKVAPGARIYMLSDGMVEARDAVDRMLGIDSIANVIAAATHAAAYDNILAHWCAQTVGGTTDDDVSLVEVCV